MLRVIHFGLSGEILNPGPKTERYSAKGPVSMHWVAPTPLPPKEGEVVENMSEVVKEV